VTDAAAAAATAAVADEDSRAYWEGLGAHELRLQVCNVCAQSRFPRMPACPTCGNVASSEVVSTGYGRIYSWIVVRRPMGSFSEDDLPVTIVTVEMDEGCRVVGRLTGAISVDIDHRVQADYVDHADWTELRFTAEVGDVGGG
jgi:hypothetical protein